MHDKYVLAFVGYESRNGKIVEIWTMVPVREK
jgi:hypothetical protein